MAKLVTILIFTVRKMEYLEKYFSQLNDAQLAPTLQKDGPMIVIAGAGSGKTTGLNLSNSLFNESRSGCF